MGPPVTQEEFQCLVMSLEQLLQRLCRTEVNTTQHSNNTPATPPILAKSGWSLKGNSLSAVAVGRFSLTHRLLQAVVSARMRNAELRPGKVHDSRLGILGRGFLKKEERDHLHRETMDFLSLSTSLHSCQNILSEKKQWTLLWHYPVLEV